jgi:hypothetical protein
MMTTLTLTTGNSHEFLFWLLQITGNGHFVDLLVVAYVANLICY